MTGGQEMMAEHVAMGVTIGTTPTPIRERETETETETGEEKENQPELVVVGSTRGRTERDPTTFPGGEIEVEATRCTVPIRTGVGGMVANYETTCTTTEEAGVVQRVIETNNRNLEIVIILNLATQIGREADWTTEPLEQTIELLRAGTTEIHLMTLATKNDLVERMALVAVMLVCPPTLADTMHGSMQLHRYHQPKQLCRFQHICQSK
jgi:hypothetical protein